MVTLGRLSHVAFKVPKKIFEEEIDFWQNLVGLTLVRRIDGGAFFAADPLRDHEFILFAVDGPVAAHGQDECILHHLAFDVATDEEVDELTERFRARGFQVDEPTMDRKQNKVTSPAGIDFEINTPPHRYTSPEAFRTRFTKK
ncbi:MAG: hypothetical protein GTO40_13165 [Deltaproteobacteria bacterium]|nr:hypothetical protein [Deltaproteobacteria bacterium]